MKKHVLILLLFFLLLSCNLPQRTTSIPVFTPAAPTQPPFSTLTFTPPPTITLTDTITSSLTSTASATFTPLPSDTATSTTIPTQTDTPTPPQALATSKANSSCLFGPNTAYLYMYTLRPKGTAEVHGRNYSGSWLWVQPTDTKLWCWVAASLVTLSVDIKSIPVENPPLPTNPSVPPPTGFHATRSGNSVTVSWNAAAPSVQLAYLIEALVCSKGNLIGVVSTTTSLSYTLNDAKTCAQASNGQLRVQNKLGYSTVVKIPWP
jgi:hypothetical protein